MKKLMSIEDLDNLCPILTEEIQLFVESNEALKGKEEAIIYALAQCVKTNVEKLDLDLADKGFVISILLKGLIEGNEDCLAVHNERARAILDGKDSTKH